MSLQIAGQWIAWAAGLSLEQLEALELTDSQVRIIGRGMARNRLLNPPKKKPVRKWGVFRCQCGCGEYFEAQYTTRKPWYKNEAHRMRAYRARRAAREG
jgi:hypothetical protein